LHIEPTGRGNQTILTPMAADLRNNPVPGSLLTDNFRGGTASKIDVAAIRNRKLSGKR